MAESASVAWHQLIWKIVERGHHTSPRGLSTLEILGSSVEVDMTNPVVLTKSRDVGYTTMLAEAAWILSGDNTTSGIVPYCRKMADFSDDGIVLRGAYGPQVVDQLTHAVESLLRDSSSRQAVITTWRPNPPISKDIPCTVSLQWMVRDGLLHAFVNMRSQDAWLGFPYDVFTFTAISAQVLLRMRDRADWGLRLGTLHLNAASHHLYERDVRKVHDVSTDQHGEIVFDPTVLTEQGELLKQLRAARDSSISLYMPSLMGLEKLKKVRM